MTDFVYNKAGSQAHPSPCSPIQTNMPATNELLQEGRYRVGERAAGNNENVFEAYDTVRNTNVVVREIPVKLNKVATVSQRESLNLAFTNQAKALSEIDHESLPHVYDYFSEIDRQYLVMDPVDGEDFASMLDKNGKAFTVAQVTDWADQLLDALHCLHTHKPLIVHRNVRPYNVYLHSSGKIKLLGVGVESGGDASDEDGTDLRYSPIEQIWPGLDAASQKAITNNYDDRSERILKGPLDARSDIYSLGATLYFLITGREPIDPLERSIDILEGKLDPLPEPTKVDPNIPAEISDVLMKALEIKRENRYDSAFIMREVLKGALARINEEEDDDVREQREAAEIIRRAAETSNVDTGPSEEEKRQAKEQEELKLREAEDEKQRQAEAEQLRLREAEEQRQREAAEQQLREAEERQRAEEQRLRLEAEQQRKAEEERRLIEERAEAERQRKEEEEAALAEAFAADADEPAVEDSLLEIPVSAEVMAYREPADIDEADLAAVLNELEAAEAAGQNAGRASRTDTVQEFDNPIDMTSQEDDSDKDEDIFSVPERSASSLPIPAIAGAIGLVVVIAVGAWFLLSGSPQPETPAAVQSVQTALPVAEPTPITEPVVSAEPDANTALPATDVLTDQPVAVAKTAQTPKPKKAEAAKPEAEKKKAVTVDDLINDN